MGCCASAPASAGPRGEASIETMQPYNINDLEVSLEAVQPGAPPHAGSGAFPMYLLDADLLKKTKALLPFGSPDFKEAALRNLRVLSSQVQRDSAFIIFVSHRWVSAKSPERSSRI